MISFSERTIFLDDTAMELEHPIADAFECEGLIIVLFAPDAYKEKFGQFSNLVAIGPTGARLWTAELPTTTSGDRYYAIASRTPLIAYSISSFECEVELATGRLSARRFYK